MEVLSETSSSVDPALGLATLSIQPEPRMIAIKGANWECRFDAQQGRFLVAKIDFQPGDIVISELPFAFIPFDGPRAQVCYNCCKMSTVLTECKACSEVSYCCIACKDAWSPIHEEFECHLHQKLNSIADMTSADATLLKLAWRIGVMATLQKRSSVASAERVFRTSSGSFEDVLSLVSHMDHYEGTPWAEAILKGCEIMIEIAQPPSDFNLSARDLLALCARINSNAHAVVPDESPKALGLFPALSLMNHSCNPNTTFSGMINGPTLYCRAMRPIKAGEELSISYVDLYQPRKERRELLLNSKFFECKCSRCSEPIQQGVDGLLEAFNCNRRGCKGILVEESEPKILQLELPKAKPSKGKKGGKPSKASSSSNSPDSDQLNEPVRVYKCTVCSSLLAAAVLDRKLEEASSLFESASELYRQGGAQANEQAKKQFESILGKFSTVTSAPSAATGNSLPLTLGDHHWLIFNAGQRLVNCCVRLGDVLGSIRALKHVVASSSRILPENEPEVGNYLAHLAEAVTQLEKQGKLGRQSMQPYIELKRDALSRALKIRTIALGEEHWLTKDTRDQASKTAKPSK